MIRLSVECIGYWERLVNVGRELIELLGLHSFSEEEKKEYEEHVGGNLYDVEFHSDPMNRYGYVSFSFEEQQRLMYNRPGITSARIIAQLRSIVKWGTLKNTIDDLK